MLLWEWKLEKRERIPTIATVFNLFAWHFLVIPQNIDNNSKKGCFVDFLDGQSNDKLKKYGIGGTPKKKVENHCSKVNKALRISMTSSDNPSSRKKHGFVFRSFLRIFYILHLKNTLLRHLITKLYPMFLMENMVRSNLVRLKPENREINNLML